MIDLDDRVCAACVKDDILSKWIAADGAMGSCVDCKRKGSTVALRALRSRIDEVFKANFKAGSGPNAADVIAEIAGIRRPTAEALVKTLVNEERMRPAELDVDRYYDAVGYVIDYSAEHSNKDVMNEFLRTIRSEARFFDNTAGSWLDDIFTDLQSQQTRNGESVIVDYNADDERAFYRARYAPTDARLLEILASPVEQMGPPPDGMAGASRMNAIGVSVFYGALDEETCLSEIRAPVGAPVVIGRFHLDRNVRLLDLDRLLNVEYLGSHFDPDYWGKRARVHMLPALVLEIARPVMPTDEAFGYLPTQFVADYLAQQLDPEIDGILFRSTQTNHVGQNVVLFNRACRVRKPDAGTEFVAAASPGKDGADEGLTLTVRSREPSQAFPTSEDDVDKRLTTLRLQLDSLQVRQILATEYVTQTQPFRVHQA